MLRRSMTTASLVVSLALVGFGLPVQAAADATLDHSSHRSAATITREGEAVEGGPAQRREQPLLGSFGSKFKNCVRAARHIHKNFTMLEVWSSVSDADGILTTTEFRTIAARGADGAHVIIRRAAKLKRAHHGWSYHHALHTAWKKMPIERNWVMYMRAVDRFLKDDRRGLNWAGILLDIADKHDIPDNRISVGDTLAYVGRRCS